MTEPNPTTDPAQAAAEAGAGNAAAVDQAVTQGGAYEVLRRRLAEQGAQLRGIVDGLNARRLEEFGDSRMEVAGRFRIRTENNCVGRDIVQVGDDLLLFGYNVYLGLKTRTRIEDVFGLYRLVEGPDGYDVTPVDFRDTLLADPGFVHDFTELYAYYKHARLLQLIVRDGKLLAAFQIGERSSDVRVFRWAISSRGEFTWIDSRGERDIALPPAFDFEWSRATRDLEETGRHPHLNILDTVFVETTGGDLTVKVENNTETGQGVYSEPVEDATQSLDDATIDFARVGSLVLLKILPYRETEWRGLVYNTITGTVTRIDAIVQACVQLPEDHGIVFPGGYYLQNGEHKAFDAQMDGMQYRRSIRSPNGEDVMYVFYHREAGRSALFVYNSIRRALQNPVFGHGYALLADGRMVLFHAEGDAPTRIHPMQVWRTPFTSEEFAARRPPGTSFMGRIGNAALVRGVSDLLELARTIDEPRASLQRYQLLVDDARRMFDAHHWIDDAHCEGAADLLHAISATGESVLDEYEKVEDIRRQSGAAIAEANAEQKALLGRLRPENWAGIGEYVDALRDISRQRGHLLTVRDLRYIDTAAIDAMGAELQEAHDAIGAATGGFLGGDKALQPFHERLKQLDADAQAAETARTLAEALDGLRAMSAELDMLSELMASLKVDDATRRTAVVEAISAIYARLNQTRARAEQKRRSLGSAEAVAQFGAQFTLFGQSIASALGLATDPERADEQLSRLMVQLEELESQFGEHEQFLGDILAKREELLDTFEGHKQTLLDDRQRRAQAVFDAAARILDGLPRRTERFASADELNAFFAGDPLILKLRELADRLRALRDSVKADDVEARLKGVRDQAVRSLRDRSDLFEDGGNVIRLGPRHRFSVNTQPLDLTILPRGDALAIHLTGTDYYETIHDDELQALRDWWQVALESESPALYRGEYLAGLVLDAAVAGRDNLDMDALDKAAADPEALERLVRDFAAPRYREGYEKGIHDHDAALLLRALLPLHRNAGALVHAPAARALVLVAWQQLQGDAEAKAWPQRAVGAEAVHTLFGSREGLDALRGDIATTLGTFVADHALPVDASLAGIGADYLVEELRSGDPTFGFSHYARDLVDALRAKLQAADMEDSFDRSLERLAARPAAQWALAAQWLQAMCAQGAYAELAGYVPEAIALLLTGRALRHRIVDTTLIARVEGLLGEHPRMAGGRMALPIDDFLLRFRRHRSHFIPGFEGYQAIRQRIASREREALRLSEFKARPLSSFVRNRLLDEVYLPIIGDNLAKQMGTVGENKRSDLMGLLMLISPPGYGKTTLMEYVADRLGLVFMKINGPALGHEVKSLDPEQAPDATSRQELEKLNLALEMGNNTMLYVDDIQHTHPEFLQKFISLCDGTRRIEGVWKGRTRTYDMRGKKFCVVMAGNPYTESGEVFRIPDMLANRADIYNLGDVLGGMEEAFKLSYIENSLTSSPVLAPLATRELSDLHLLADKSSGHDVSTNNLSHVYSGAEVNEIVATLQRLMQVRDVVYRVNQQYIASAAQSDRYRTEPPFKLQGSYRNMNKLAEKVSPVMNAAELQQLIADHYMGESQLLTTGAEENLLKLAELRGTMTTEQSARWEQVKRDFLRNKAMGGEDADTGARVVAQLADIASGLQSLQDLRAGAPAQAEVPWDALLASLQANAVRSADALTDTGATDTPWLQALPEAMRGAFEPMLAHLSQGQDRQAELNVALVKLLDLLRTKLADAPAPGSAPTRRRRTPTAQEIELEELLRQLRIRNGEKPDEV
ncbi:DNA repair ATPase [Luteimonas sp. A501]